MDDAAEAPAAPPSNPPLWRRITADGVFRVLTVVGLFAGVGMLGGIAVQLSIISHRLGYLPSEEAVTQISNELNTLGKNVADMKPRPATVPASTGVLPEWFRPPPPDDAAAAIREQTQMMREQQARDARARLLDR